MSEPRRDLPVPVRVDLRRPDGSASVEYAINLSPSGVCLQVRERLDPGERIHLAFDLPLDGSRLSAHARVVWCTCEEREGQRFFEVGARFEDADEVIREKLHRFATRPADPRR